jgi:PTH1 family peptidyl-tRNA hydrolase
VRRAVVGLGNPGARYERTRHNAGFFVVDLLAHAHGVTVSRRQHDALWGEIELAGTGLALIKPQGFMNRSGAAVAAFARELCLASSDILVVHDDLDLALARIKLKRGGGTAGHRGLESIVEHLGTNEFARLRVGIGRPPEGQEVADFVLTTFSEAERAILGPGLAAAAAGVEAWCALGIDAAMNVVNAARPDEPGPATGPAS